MTKQKHSQPTEKQLKCPHNRLQYLSDTMSGKAILHCKDCELVGSVAYSKISSVTPITLEEGTKL